MARAQSEREDLLREATALVERAELLVPPGDEPIVVGFRRDGAASLYFGADPVYQFNTAGELRRAYVGGLLYKAERGRLIELRRQLGDNEVALIRREPIVEETDALLAEMRRRLSQLHEALGQGRFTLAGQVPADADITSRLKNWLHSLPHDVRIASTPNAR